jgi:hypothetical protein
MGQMLTTTAVRSRTSIWLVVLFVVTALGLIVVSQTELKFGIYHELSCSGCPNDREYRAWSSIAGTQYEPYRRWFVQSRSQMQTDAIKARIQAELDDKRTLARLDPSSAAFAVLLAMLLSPELLILAVVGGWWARTAPIAMFCGLGAALVHDFLKMLLNFLRCSFPAGLFLWRWR